MIASLQGKLEFLGNDYAIVDVNGVGFQVFMPTTTLSTLGNPGGEVHVRTSLVVREDSVTLYGFTSADELWLFQTLMGVSGVGPRLALSILSTIRADELSMAIASGNTELLTTAPGVGKKIASRLVLELKDKISGGLKGAPALQIAQENSEVLNVLTSLGYSVSEASRAVATLPPSEDLSLEEKVKLALQYFAQQ